MSRAIEKALDALLRREGGFVDHPHDRGGPTRFGITANTLGLWRGYGRAATADEVGRLSKAEAREIYRERFIEGPGFDVIRSQLLLDLLVDSAAHSGTDRAVRWLQGALGVTVDGINGPETRAALTAADPETLRTRILAYRVRHLGRLITRDPRQALFAEGWMNRVAEFLEV